MQPPRQYYLRSRAIIQYENRLLGPNDCCKTKTMSPWNLSWSQQNVNNAFDQSEIAPKICNTQQASTEKDDRLWTQTYFRLSGLFTTKIFRWRHTKAGSTCVMGYGWVFWKFDWLEWFPVPQSFLEWRTRQAQNVYKSLRPDLFSYPLRFATDRRGVGNDMCHICAYNSVYSSYFYKKTGHYFVPW